MLCFQTVVFCIHCKRYSSILSRILALVQGLVFFRIYIYLVCRQYATYSLDCENLYLPGGQRVYLYYQDFKWSSTLFTFTRQCHKLQCFSHLPKRGEHLFFLFHFIFNTFSCEPTEDDILAALMQLLPCVCLIMHIIHVCGCVYV